MFKIELRPRFSETDGFQHVGNTVLPVWLESAREPLFDFIIPDVDYMEWPFIVAHYSVDFIKQIFLGEIVEITSDVSKIGNTSFTVYHEVFQSSNIVAKGEVVIVYFDYKLNKPVIIPDMFRDRLEESKSVMVKL